MRTELIDKKAVEATVRVTVPAEQVDAAFEEVVSDLARRVKIPGFRPGRVPRGVLVKRVGEDALAEEVKEKLIDAHFQAAMKEHELLPISTHFHAHDPVRGEDYSFEIHSELYPEVTLPDLAGIALETEAAQVTDEMVAQAVEELRRENATLVPVDRPVEPTDWVLIEAESLPAESDDAAAAEASEAAADATGEGGETAEAEAKEAGAAQPASAFPVDLERAGEELREQLVGAAMGEERVVAFTDEVDAQPDGTPTVRRMRVKVVDVKAKEKPEAGPELATQLGMDSWDAVLERLRSSLAEDLARQTYEARRSELIDKLVDGSTLELPPGLVRRRQQTLLENLVQDLQQRGETFQSYLARLDARGQREEFERELLETAERGVKRDLVLERLMEVRGTQLTNAELTEALRFLAAQRRQDVGSFVRDMGEEWVANYRFMLTRDKAVRELIAELTGEETAEADAESLVAAAEASLEAEDEAHDHEHEHDHHDEHDHEHGDGHEH
ncbi:MAG TPA: trigger factor [Trueperaceae bacterium]|nr:trigger factor [Trueperaceae bacterium]